MNQAALSYPMFVLLCLGGCAAVPTPLERQKTLETLSSEHNLTSTTLHTTPFSLYSLSDTRRCEDREMRVYIEGDGFAWRTRSQLSNDPTPINPLAAKLMSIDPSHCKVYLARPCQYTQESQCSSQYWSNRRFSPEVIQSYSEALDQIKKSYGIKTFTLIGYSGGGAVAALSTAKRNDVKQLISIAGNLDIEAWINYHHLSSLDGSLNPADESKKLSEIDQLHLIGRRDAIIPIDVYQSYAHHFMNRDRLHSKECAECTHNTGWIEEWKEILPTLDTIQKGK